MSKTTTNADSVDETVTPSHFEQLPRDLVTAAHDTQTRIVDAYARLLSRLAAAHDKLADESQMEWTGHMLRAQASAMRQVADASTKIVRD
jgi:hypothetical protein